MWLYASESVLFLVAWLRSHDSRLVTALTIDSGSMTLFCFHFWLLDSGTVTPVLWLCDSDYVTLCLRVCFISGPMILVAWFRNCYCFDYWLPFHDSFLLSFLVAWLRYRDSGPVTVWLRLCHPNFQASGRSRFPGIRKVNQNYMHPEICPEFEASGIPSEIWGIQKCHPNFEASGKSRIPSIWKVNQNYMHPIFCPKLRHPECHP